MAEDSPKTALEAQIEAEAKELREAPIIQPSQWVGSHRRCHICGQIYSEHDLQPFDQHTGQVRHGCPNCHPNRGHRA